MKSLVAALVLAVGLPAYAGDYYLFVADSPTCAKPTVGESHPAQTVVEDVDRYFSGLAPQIVVFEAALQNGSVGFCSPAERQAIEDALIAWVVRGPSDHELQLYGLFTVLGSQRVVDELATRLAAATDLSLKNRLTRAREASRLGVRIRGR